LKHRYERTSFSRVPFAWLVISFEKAGDLPGSVEDVEHLDPLRYGTIDNSMIPKFRDH
jgi:hypothetical protein